MGSHVLEIALLYDLHCHSTASDGVLSPADLVTRAHTKGVTHLALTDHDTVGGLAEAAAVAAELGLQLINGIEISSQWQGINIHIVGLNIDIKASSLATLIESQHRARAERAEEIARRLAKLGFENCLQGAARYAGGDLLGRPHFARYLVEIGAVSSVNQAFKKYLGNGKAGDVKQGWPEFEQVIQAIKEAGGIAVLAHPLRYGLTITKLRRLLEYFVKHGGQGLEVVSGQQSSNETETLVGLGERFSLYASCGSDFHVPDQPWQDLGGFGKLPAPCTPVWHAWSVS